MVGRSDLVGKTYHDAFPELAATELPDVLDPASNRQALLRPGGLLVPLAKGPLRDLVGCFFAANLDALRDISGHACTRAASPSTYFGRSEARRPRAALERAQVERGLRSLRTRSQGAAALRTGFPGGSMRHEPIRRPRSLRHQSLTRDRHATAVVRGAGR
jgi:hypothetical protein